MSTDRTILIIDDDIDLVEIHGYGFPRWRGGPMFHAARRGLDGLKQDLVRPPSVSLIEALRVA